MGLLSNLLNPARAAGHKLSSLVIDGDEVPVTLCRNRNARRFILRLDKTRNGVVVTLPASGSDRQAMEFAASQAVWIKKQLSSATPGVSFADGSIIPLRGVDHCVVHQANSRGTVWLSDADPPQLNVAGREQHIDRRLKDWLKREAKHDLLAASRRYAQALNVTFSRVSVRDQSTRWGSCSSTGVLSYSWRLILAPPFVLDYVAAHEVAHLKEMNHSPRFWSLVKSHCTATRDARHWLKTHGRQLHNYG